MSKEVLGDDNVEVLDYVPEHFKSEVPVLALAGWSISPDTFGEPLKLLSEHGRRVVSPFANGPHEQGPKLELFEKVLDAKDLKKVDGIGYSEGGLYLALLAAANPERFRNIVLIAPAGMVGQTMPAHLTVGLLKDFLLPVNKLGERKALIQKVLRDLLSHTAKSPGKAIDEIHTIAEADIYPLLEALKGEGIGISIISGAEDSVFPMGKMQGLAKAKHLDGFYSVKGGHAEILANPEQYMDIVDFALDDLEKKS